MVLFFKTRQAARDFAAKRKESGLPTTCQDRGNVTNPLTGSKYAANLRPIK